MFKTAFKSVTRAKALAAALAIAAAVILPQIFHVAGAAAGFGNGFGLAFLPMHLSILAVGLLFGSFAGVAAGLISPILSYALTGMPSTLMLPIMTVELAAYGLAAGLISRVKLPLFLKVLIVQILGRVARTAAILIAIGLGSTIAIDQIWTAIIVGLPGIMLQWLLIPLLVYRLKGLRGAL